MDGKLLVVCTFMNDDFIPFTYLLVNILQIIPHLLYLQAISNISDFSKTLKCAVHALEYINVGYFPEFKTTYLFFWLLFLQLKKISPSLSLSLSSFYFVYIYIVQSYIICDIVYYSTFKLNVHLELEYIFLTRVRACTHFS